MRTLGLVRISGCDKGEVDLTARKTRGRIMGLIESAREKVDRRADKEIEETAGGPKATCMRASRKRLPYAA
jgi:hypothetical protein